MLFEDRGGLLGRSPARFEVVLHRRLTGHSAIQEIMEDEIFRMNHWGHIEPPRGRIDRASQRGIGEEVCFNRGLRVS
jgi:hypothetical protein